MEALKFFEIADVPGTMKDLNKLYRRLSLKYHPDKNSGSPESTKQYQELQMHFKRLGDYVLSNNVNMNVNNDGDQEDEQFNRDLFRDMFKKNNKDKKNQHCHVVVIERHLAKLWKPVFEKYLGQHESQGPHRQYIYKDRQYTVNDELLVSARPITVTLYDDVQEPKIHIQSGSQVHNGYYVLYELPRLYQEVRASVPPGKMALRTRPNSSNAKKASMPLIFTGNKTSNVRTLICKFQSCDFSSKVKKQLSGHYKAAHNEKFDSQRDLEDMETIVEELAQTLEDEEVEENDEMEEASQEISPAPTTPAQIKDRFQPNVTMVSTAPPVSLDPTNFNLQQEKEKLKETIGEKEKIIDELRGKMKELDKENKKLKMDIKTIKSDHADATRQSQEYCEANTVLRTKVKTYQDMEVANMEILEKYEELKKKHKKLKDKIEPGDSDNTEDSAQENADIQMLAHFKKVGSRRSPNSDRPVPQPQPSAEPSLLKCDRCIYKTISAERLKDHYKQKHFNCDLCDITLGTARALRTHNKSVHKAPGGTA